MPFTLAHPIATAPIWWLSRRRLDLSALFIGSMMPDIAYFIHLQPVQNIGHRGYGVLVQGLPWGLVLLAVMQYGLKRPCLALMPSQIVKRISPEPYCFLPLGRLSIIVLSLVIGAFSHIGWDAFTHSTGWGVRLLPGLNNDLGPVALYKGLQYGGGVFGLLALGLWFCRWLMQTRPDYDRLDRFPRHLRLSIGLGLAIATFLFTIRMLSLTGSLSQIMVRAVIIMISGSVLSLCVYSLGFWFSKLWLSND